MPTQVLLHTISNASGYSDNRGYNLWLFYENLGILISYEGIVKLAPIFHICPQLDVGGDIDRIDLLLQSKDNPQPLDRDDGMLSPTGTVIVQILTIEEAAQLKLDEFYRLFTQTDKIPCFDTPSNLWP